MDLMMSDPDLAKLDCRTCRLYHLDSEYKPVLIGGEPLKREGPTPCDTELGCPKGHYTDPIELTGYAAALLYTYRLCQATADFPHGEWFATFAAIIKGIDEKHATQGAAGPGRASRKANPPGNGPAS